MIQRLRGVSLEQGAPALLNDLRAEVALTAQGVAAWCSWV